MKKTIAIWAGAGAALGLLVPALFWLVTSLSGWWNGHVIGIAWPSYILVMALDQPHPPSAVATVVVVSLMVGVNVILYSSLAALVSSAWQHARAGHEWRSIFYAGMGSAIVIAWVSFGMSI